MYSWKRKTVVTLAFLTVGSWMGCSDPPPTPDPTPSPTAVVTATPLPPTAPPTSSPTQVPTPLLDADGDGYAWDEDDCDDADDHIYPGAVEVPYDGIDQDCSSADLTDVDEDGYDALVVGGQDCDDGDQHTYPQAPELGDSKDNDCDGEVDEGVDSVDNDHDGTSELEGDCDDEDPSIHPSAPEIPYDGIDQDCSGLDLKDVDEDGSEGGGEGPDCNDEDASIHPGAAEIPYDEIDQNCDGMDLTDQDLDGTPGGDGGDCDDLDPTRAPGFVEIAYDGIDQDCSGADLTDQDEDGQDALEAGGMDCDDLDETRYQGAPEIPYDDVDQDCSGADLDDQDGDSFIGIPADGNDCNDLDLNTYPGAAEFEDDQDNDCDGKIDEDLDSNDDDGDGFSELEEDCNDGDSSVYPGASEVAYDGIDQSCDGVDLVDVDGDGFASVLVEGGQDCDDTNASIFPTASETPYDGIDQDCSGLDLTDVDGDGYDSTSVTGGTDCNDTAGLIHPDATEKAYDGIDQDCSGKDLTDVDGDGFDGTSVTGGTDCQDTNDAIHPAAIEVCDTIDNNCDGTVDLDAVDRGTYYLDGDHDTFGDPQSPVLACSSSSVLVADASDCDDSRASINPAAPEICDTGNLDEDCDGLADNEDSSADSAGMTRYYPDADEDGFGSAASSGELHCDDPSSPSATFLTEHTDCDDTVADTHPGGLEICDSLNADEDCNGLADDLDPGTSPDSKTRYYPDADQDGYGAATSSGALYCDDPSTPVAAQVTNNSDCNDAKSAVNPGVSEICDGVDNDCSGKADEFSGLCGSSSYCVQGQCSGDQGTGVNGALTMASSTQINTVATPASGTAGQPTLTLTSPTGFGAGAMIFIHQSQGTSAGTWEVRRIAALNGSVASLEANLVGNYVTSGSNKAQAVVMPQYTTVTLNNGTLSAPAWNGSTGGILAFAATGAVTVGSTANISMSALGYRGHARINTTHYAGYQGEGTLGTEVQKDTPNGNGGGGGAQTMCNWYWGAPGGGGGHASAGSIGTTSQAPTCNPRGQGGAAVGSPAQTTIFFGGGGGMGSADEDGYGSNGASGGGLIFMAAPEVTVTGTIQSNGAAGDPEYNFAGCGSGGGGGGAGGAIYLKTPKVSLGSSRVTASGGVGGINPSNCGDDGGAGSVGRITLKGTTSVSGSASPAHHLDP